MAQETAEKGAKRLLTASEARGISDKVRMKGINDILALIESEANKGETVLCYYHPIDNSVIKELTDIGYDVLRFPSGYKIKW